MMVDPRWITTSTSFNDLTQRGKTSRIDGLAQLKRIEHNSDVAVFTPLMFGLRLTAAAAAVNGDIALAYQLQDEEATEA